MTERNIDLTESFPSEDVWHPVRIDKVEEKPSKSSSDNQLIWHLTITEGDDLGLHVFDSTSLSTKAVWRIRQYYEACGFEVPGSSWDEQDLVNASFQMRGDLEEYDGQKRFKIKEMKPLV